MANVMLFVLWIQLNVSNPILYSYLTLASELCGVFRMYPVMYTCKVCIDVVRESMKVYIINR